MASMCLPGLSSTGCLHCSLATIHSSFPASSLVCSRGVNSFVGRNVWTRSSVVKRSASFCVLAGLRAVESYDASFQLEPEANEILRKVLSAELFCAQVAEQSQKDPNVKFEFTGDLFQPVPWSPTTKFGMPIEFERFFHDKENFTIVNVPPNFMFKAKIFKPSRLCAIYKRIRN